MTLLALLWPLGPEAAAQEGSWRAVDGPYGAIDVTALANADAIYAGTSGGIYRSMDGGASWEVDRADGSGSIRDIRSLVTLGDGSLVAGTYGGGLYRRIDGAWTHLEGSRGFVQSVAASASGILYAGTTTGILRSVDGGATWMSTNVAGRKQTVRALVAYGDVVMAGTSLGIYRSEDRGVTWTVASLGLSDLNVSALFRASDGTLFAGTTPIYGGCSLFRSRSEGRLWACMEPDQAPLRVEAITEGSDGTILVGGYRQIARSGNGGNSWTVVQATASTVRAVLASGSVMLGGTTGRGIVRSGDSGYTYASSSTGIRSSISDLADTPEGDLYVATLGGVYRGTRDGSDWTLLDRATETLASARSLLVEPNGLLTVATSAGARQYDPRNDDWTDLGPPGFPAVRALARAPDGSIWMGYYAGVYRLQAGRWTPYPIVGGDQATRDVQAVTVDADGQVFAGASYDSFVRTDPQAEWAQLIGANVPYFEASVFVTGPDGSLYAGTRYAGVLRSTDGGQMWYGFGEGLMGSEDIRSIAFDAAGAPWIATYGSGVYRYESGFWSNRSAGLEGSMRVTDLHFDQDGIAWAGTDGGGLYRYESAQGTAALRDAVVPSGFTAGKPYPNPASGSARIRIDLPEPAGITIEIFDLLGRRSAARQAGTREAGAGEEFDLPVAGLSPGLYLVRLTATTVRSRFVSTEPIVIER